MQTVNKKIGCKFYNRLFAHCNKQYKNISVITKAYSECGIIFGIDYIDNAGMVCISSNTFSADTVILFSE